MKNNVGWLFENLKNHQFSNLKIFKNKKIDFNSSKIIRIKKPLVLVTFMKEFGKFNSLFKSLILKKNHYYIPKLII